MTAPQRWVVGIDPGFGMTGLVLRPEDSPDVTAWACYSLDWRDAPDVAVLRAASLATAAVECVIGWINEHSIRALEVCIELPIYRHHAQTLILQCRLLEEIEQGLASSVEPNLPACWLTEVNPKTSKYKLAKDGNATKKAMIAASPFAGLEETDAVREALADAYAHSLSAGVRQYDLKALRMVAVAPSAVSPPALQDNNAAPTAYGKERLP